jgi:hypothetical protein
MTTSKTKETVKKMVRKMEKAIKIKVGSKAVCSEGVRVVSQINEEGVYANGVTTPSGDYISFGSPKMIFPSGALKAPTTIKYYGIERTFIPDFKKNVVKVIVKSLRKGEEINDEFVIV